MTNQGQEFRINVNLNELPKVGDSMNNAKLAKKIAGRILKMDGPNKEEEIKIHWWNVS